MAVRISRELREGDLVFVGVGTAGRAFTLAVGIPLVASRLAQLRHAPSLDIYWGNLLNPDLGTFPASLSQDAITRWRGAYAPADVGYKVDMLARGEFDVSFESAPQIDRHGNLNITEVNSGDRDVRLVGTLAQPEHYAFVQRPIVVADLSPRTFVDSVDFITSFGFGAGGGRRAALGYATPGPHLVVTDLCVFDFFDEQMRLIEVYPGVSVDDVLARMSFEPLVAEPRVTGEPSAEELTLIRDHIDTHGVMLAD